MPADLSANPHTSITPDSPTPPACLQIQSSGKRARKTKGRREDLLLLSQPSLPGTRACRASRRTRGHQQEREESHLNFNCWKPSMPQALLQATSQESCPGTPSMPASTQRLALCCSTPTDLGDMGNPQVGVWLHRCPPPAQLPPPGWWVPGEGSPQLAGFCSFFKASLYLEGFPARPTGEDRQHCLLPAPSPRSHRAFVLPAHTAGRAKSLPWQLLPLPPRQASRHPRAGAPQVQGERHLTTLTSTFSGGAPREADTRGGLHAHAGTPFPACRPIAPVGQISRGTADEATQRAMTQEKTRH